MNSTKYVLLTSAKNEQDFIIKTMESVISQTLKPMLWVIVNDGSTDRTENIILSYVRKFNFIHLFNIQRGVNRSFGSKAKAIMYAFDSIRHDNFDFVGNLDADISFESTYYERLISKFHENKNLGIGGGIRYDFCNNKFKRVKCAEDSVGGPFQFFRKKCFEDIGGYKPLTYGGIDALAEISARMLGWEVKSFDDLQLYHHRCTGIARGRFIHRQIVEGEKFYNLGYDSLFFSLKTSKKIFSKPFFLNFFLTMFGFFHKKMKREKREVSFEVQKFLKDEQRKKIRSMINIRLFHKERIMSK